MYPVKAGAKACLTSKANLCQRIRFLSVFLRSFDGHALVDVCLIVADWDPLQKVLFDRFQTQSNLCNSTILRHLPEVYKLAEDP